jgi:hypothetical protein
MFHYCNEQYTCSLVERRLPASYTNYFIRLKGTTFGITFMTPTGPEMKRAAAVHKANKLRRKNKVVGLSCMRHSLELPVAIFLWVV